MDEPYQQVLFTKPIKEIEDITKFVMDNLEILTPKQKGSIFDGSVFQELRNGNPHERGRIGETLVILLGDSCGFSVERKHKYGDVVINGIITEVKTAFQKEDGGFLVNQIRPQAYDYLIIVAFTPKTAQVFTVDKDYIWNKAIGQHGGNGAKETRIYSAKSYNELKTDFYDYAGIDKFKSTYKRDK